MKGNSVRIGHTSKTVNALSQGKKENVCFCVCVSGEVNNKYKNKFCLDHLTKEKWTRNSSDSFLNQGFIAAVAQGLGNLPLDKYGGCWLVNARVGPEKRVLTWVVWSVMWNTFEI